MAASSTLTLLESLAQRAEARAASRSYDVVLRTQVAFVRALVDEIQRRPESDVTASALLDQLEEETMRLARMLPDDEMMETIPPVSGIHRRS